MSCSLKSCSKANSQFQCSKCKSVRYCCSDHQKLDWSYHKAFCKDISMASSSQELDKKTTATTNESRHCRCMFCGDKMTLESEEEAIRHMSICPALQEQFQSKEQFTIPSVVKEKMSK